MYEAVLFDLDGTLLDTLKDLADSVNYMLSSLSLPERSLDEVREFVGNGVRRLITRSLPPYFADTEAAEGLFREYYSRHSMDKTEPYDGIIELLSSLRNRGVKTGVITNKPDTAAKPMCERYFPGLLDICAGERAGVPRKPAPDLVLKALEALEVTPEGCLYVGDSDTDILTARNAGIACLSVTWGFRTEEFLLEHGAKRLAHTPREALFSILTR